MFDTVLLFATSVALAGLIEESVVQEGRPAAAPLRSAPDATRAIAAQARSGPVAPAGKTTGQDPTATPKGSARLGGNGVGSLFRTCFEIQMPSP